MQQYFIEQHAEPAVRILMSDEQAHHISHVMRMKEQEQIRIVDPASSLYLAAVHYEGKQVYADILEPIVDMTRNRVKITLLQGMIKKEKWDFLLQKSAELGVDRIVPFTSSRSVVKAKEERLDKKMQRWNKILLEACEQCKRSTRVDLCEPCDLKQTINFAGDLNLIAYEDADACSEKLCDVLKQHPDVSHVTLAIGCEGGFSKEEVDMFVAQGWHRVSLGTRILRSETAAMAGINSISFFYEMAGEA